MADGGEYCRISDLELLPGATEAKLSSDFPYTITFGDPEWNPIGQPNDVWVDRSKGAVTRADLGIIAEFVDQIIIMFDPVLESAPASPSGL